MTIKNIGERLEGADAVYRSKKIATWIVELIGRKDGGAMIKIWSKATPDDIESAEKLPHIFSVTEDQQFNLLDEVHFMYIANAEEEYQNVKTVHDAIHLAWRNR